MLDKLSQEISSFSRLWLGGFRTGYDLKRNQKGIEDYLKKNLNGDDTLLEIGCGGGQWSRFLYPYVKKLYCIDVLSAEHNQFWDYVGRQREDRIIYHQVDDFSLSCIPDNSIDYVFSYDVFCHISLSGQSYYLNQLKKKCRPGAILNIMYADADKFYQSEPAALVSDGHRQEYGVPDGSVLELKMAMVEDCDGAPREGRWYWVGIPKFIKLCEAYQYDIIEKDLNLDKTNPMTLFRMK